MFTMLLFTVSFNSFTAYTFSNKAVEQAYAPYSISFTSKTFFKKEEQNIGELLHSLILLRKKIQIFSGCTFLFENDGVMKEHINFQDGNRYFSLFWILLKLFLITMTINFSVVFDNKNLLPVIHVQLNTTLDTMNLQESTDGLIVMFNLLFYDF